MGANKNMAFIFFLFFRGGMKRGVCGVGVATTATKEQLQRQQHNTQLKQQQQHPSLSTVQKCISGGGASLSATTEGRLCVCVCCTIIFGPIFHSNCRSLFSPSVCVLLLMIERLFGDGGERVKVSVCVQEEEESDRPHALSKHREIAADNDYKSYRAYTCKS